MRPLIWDRGQWRETEVLPDDILVVNPSTGFCRVKRPSQGKTLWFEIAGQRVWRLPFQPKRVGDDVIELMVLIDRKYQLDLSSNGAIDWVLQKPSGLAGMFSWRRYLAVLAESLRQTAP